MPKKTKKGIAAPLGLIFGVILAIVLVILAVFIAFNISSTAVKQQAKALTIVGEPVIYYSETAVNNEHNVTKLVFTIANPTSENATITSVVVKGVEGNVVEPAGGTIPAGQTVQVVVEFTNQTGYPVVSDNEIARGYIEFTVVTNVATLQAVALPLPAASS